MSHHLESPYLNHVAGKRKKPAIQVQHTKPDLSSRPQQLKTKERPFRNCLTVVPKRIANRRKLHVRQKILYWSTCAAVIGMDVKDLTEEATINHRSQVDWEYLN